MGNLRVDLINLTIGNVKGMRIGTNTVYEEKVTGDVILSVTIR